MMSIFLLFFQIYILDKHSTVQCKTVHLNPNNPSEDGASITTLKDVSVSDNYWYIAATDEYGFHLDLTLDNAWSFHSTEITTIKIEIGSVSQIGTGDKDLILSFSQWNSRYFSTAIQIDENADNIVYPSCDNTYPYTQLYATGDIYSLSYNDNPSLRQRKLFGNGQWGYIQPEISPNNIDYPLTFVLQNYPIDNYMLYTYENPGVVNRSCGYTPSMSSNIPLNVYIAVDESGENFYITYINVTYIIDETTIPTSHPTARPTAHPTTLSPSVIPTNYPTMSPSKEPTNTPTMYPSKSPISTFPTESPTVPTTYPSITTLEPTINPTTIPTLEPTSITTLEPTRNPTILPSLEPTIHPTTNPTTIPTLEPTSITTLEPTRNPTILPSLEPTIHPTINPTTIPTLEPTISPTNVATLEPTEEHLVIVDETSFIPSYTSMTSLPNTNVFTTESTNIIISEDIESEDDVSDIDSFVDRYGLFVVYFGGLGIICCVLCCCRWCLNNGTPRNIIINQKTSSKVSTSSIAMSHTIKTNTTADIRQLSSNSWYNKFRTTSVLINNYLNDTGIKVNRSHLVIPDVSPRIEYEAKDVNLINPNINHIPNIVSIDEEDVQVNEYNDDLKDEYKLDIYPKQCHNSVNIVNRPFSIKSDIDSDYLGSRNSDLNTNNTEEIVICIASKNDNCHYDFEDNFDIETIDNDMTLGFIE